MYTLNCLHEGFKQQATRTYYTALQVTFYYKLNNLIEIQEIGISNKEYRGKFKWKQYFQQSAYLEIFRTQQLFPAIIVGFLQAQ